MRLPLAIFVLSLSVGCASQPASQAPPATVATPAAAATPATQPGVAPAAPAATGTADAKRQVPSGYTEKKRNGETVYCKNVARIGSNLKTETCVTPEQAEEMARSSNFDRQEFSRGRAVCGTGGCGGT
jgi:hypothetical protein